MYIIGYGIGRYWVEGLRIDRADEMLGLRWNQWVSIIAIVGGAAVLAWMRRHPIAEPVSPAPADEAEPIPDAEPTGDADPVGETEAVDDAEHSGGEPTA